MMFKKAFDHILRVEGGFVDNPNDPGGRTNLGITQHTFSRWLKDCEFPQADVRNIQREEAFSIYRSLYWLEGQCQKLPYPINIYHFDGYVNLLPMDAGMVLQRALNASGLLLDSLVVDGLVGPKTIRATNLDSSDTLVLTEYFWERIRLYRRKVKANKTKLEFLPTWLWRLDKLREV